MNSKKILGSLACGTVVFGYITVAAFAASVISNGSFENGTEPGVFTTVHPGDTTITNWSVTSGNVDYIGTYWQASNGTRSIDMNGDTAGAISQNVPTTVGASYAVSFDLSGNPSCGPSVKTLNGDTGGTPMSFTYDTGVMANTLADMKWTQHSFSFTATSATTPLTFTSQTAGACGPALDNVSVDLLPPTNEKQCKHDGWKMFSNPSFANQGQCIKYVEDHEGSIVGNPEYTAYGLHREIQFSAQENDLGTHTASGWLQYTDANHSQYVVQISYLHVVGNNAYFAGKVLTASNPTWVGNWLLAQVQKDTPDKVWGSFTDMTTAINGVMNATSPADGPFTVTGGHILIHP